VGYKSAAGLQEILKLHTRRSAPAVIIKERVVVKREQATSKHLYDKDKLDFSRKFRMMAVPSNQ